MSEKNSATPSPFIKLVSKYYEAISLTFLAVVRLLTAHYSGEKHMTPCLLLPMIVLKLHSTKIKYPIIFAHFLLVNWLMKEPLFLQIWIPLFIVLSVLIEYLHRADRHVFI